MAFQLRVIHTNGGCNGITRDSFIFGGAEAALAIAYVSPQLDLQRVIATLKQAGATMPLLAVSTAGELCAEKQNSLLYIPTDSESDSVVLQLFPPDLFAAVYIASVPLHNADIRNQSYSLQSEIRVQRIMDALEDVTPEFLIDARDTVALTFVDGLSHCENYLMEAIYRSGRFPCMFVGSASGGKLDFKASYIYDGARVCENRAVIAFLKLAPGRSYGVLKTQNFEAYGHVLEVADANPDKRTVYAVYDKKTNAKRPFAHYLAELLNLNVGALPEFFKQKTFALRIGQEYYVRSVSGVDSMTGAINFYCDVNVGDALHLVRAVDFEQRTINDIAEFLSPRPPTLGALLNDCILRRLNNPNDIQKMASSWPMPVAGFSTFGEIFGINVNQTLSALVFFDSSATPTWVDPFVAQFPIYYAGYSNYFSYRREQAKTNLKIRMAHAAAQHMQNIGVSQSLQLGVITIDSAGTILMINKTVETMFGYESSELLGKNVNMLMPEPESSAHSGHLASYLQTGKAKIAESGREVVALRKDKSQFHMHLSVTRLIEEGQIRFVGICRDISAQKTQEAALLAEKEQALYSSKAQADFLSNMSHELRTPMHAILNYAKMGLGRLEAEDTEKLRKYLTNIHVAGERLLILLNNLLDLAKMESGRQEYKLSNADFSEVTDHALMELDSLLKAKSLQCRVTSTLASNHAVFDKSRMIQVMINLLSNAIKFSPGGGVIHVEMSEMNTSSKGIVFHCAVTDEGQGIPDAELEIVFDKFIQSSKTKTGAGGTGLGLSICREIVEAHGGRIWAENSKYGGAVFNFTLPRQQEAAEIKIAI